MLHELLACLRQDLQLPRCIQIVSLLRRMEVFTESELRLKFLQARDTWLKSSLAAIPNDDRKYENAVICRLCKPVRKLAGRCIEHM